MSKVLEFPADRITKGVHSYTPEMGQRKPNCQMQLSIGHYGGYFVRTKLELKGRGITLVDTSESGERKYKLSDNAFEKLKTQYSISSVSSLD
jgi:hypothetical protein